MAGIKRSEFGTRVGVSGHQYRVGIDWPWVRNAVRRELARCGNVAKALTSLAVGSDQIFAETAIELRIPVIAVLPLAHYERYFDGDGLLQYRRLLGQSERIQLSWGGDAERAFFEAGKFIVDNSDLLIVIWDGQPTEGLGGTADIVEYAKGKRCRVIHIDPIQQRVSRSAIA